MSDDIPAGTSHPARVFVAPQPGERITCDQSGNTYTVGEKIGSGGFSTVYAGTDVWGNELAIKVLEPKGTYDDVKLSAQREINNLVALRNPYITFVYDAFEYRDTFYIVTEKCHCPLRNLFTLNNFNGLVWIVPIARSLLQAVHYLHINNHAHKDIHLENVFVTFVRDEMVSDTSSATQFKLGDFGISRMIHEIDSGNTMAQWMLPPEHIDEKEFGPVDHRIDIYHVGLVLLQLATSKLLTFSEQEILDGNPREIALTLDEPFRTAIEKSLRRHVKYRTSSALEMWKDIAS